MAQKFFKNWFSSPSSLDNVYQEHLAKGGWALYLPKGSSTAALDVLGGPALTASAGAGAATATSRAVANTSLFTTRKRNGMVGNALAGSLAGYEQTVAQYMRGTIANTGGFRLVFQIGVVDTLTAANSPLMFWGLASTVSAIGATTNPNTLTDAVGIGISSQTGNLQLIYNGASGTANVIDLGANFPANTNGVDWYYVAIECGKAFEFGKANRDIQVHVYRVNNDVTGNQSAAFYWKYIIDADDAKAPTPGTLMALHLVRSNNAQATSAGLDFGPIAVGIP